MKNKNRARTSIPVEFQVGAQKASGKIKNVGPDGLFVGSRAIPDQGEPVSLQVSFPDQAPIEVMGIVWWTTQDQPDRQFKVPGFGLRLIEENEAYGRAVGALLN